RPVDEAGYGYMSLLMASPSSAAAWMADSAAGIRPQFGRPLDFRWEMCTRVPPSTPIRTASAMADSSDAPSPRMWVAYSLSEPRCRASATNSSVSLYTPGG